MNHHTDCFRARWLPMLVAGLILGGCAAAPPEGETPRPVEEDLATILNQPLDADEYGEPRRCVSSMALRNFQVLGDRYVLFEGPRGQFWLNELRMRCPGLRSGPTAALIFESGPGAQICDLDRFAATDDWFLAHREQRRPWYRPQPWQRELPWDTIPCTLGAFQPVSAEQVDAIRATFDQR
jgi:hypothetical protein